MDDMVARGPHVVAIGGGGGASQVLRAVEPFAGRRTAIIAVTDTGRSTGVARAIGHIPAPGDLRSVIATFAADPLIADLLQYRFDGAAVPQLEGMAFGNLLIAALTGVTGDFSMAVQTAARMAGTMIEVLPIATADTQLCAELEDGQIIEGELAVRTPGHTPVRRLFLREPTPAHPPALAAIRTADLVVLGPGSLNTTVLADLLFDGMAEALRTARGQVVYVCNTTTQTGQTEHLDVADHVARIVDVVGRGVLDVALINQSTPSPTALERLHAEGLRMLPVDDQQIARVNALGVCAVVRALTEQDQAGRRLWNKQDTLRHDPAALSAAFRELL